MDTPKTEYMAGFEAQYRRMTRWLERIEDMAELGKGEINTEELRDFFIAYFQTCYHLRDHLEKDSNTNISESNTQSYIETTECLSLCGDICNATKHLELDTSGFTGEHPEISEGAELTVSLTPSEGESSATYRVETDSGDEDAYQLAKDCKDAWDGFIQSNGLYIPN